eukprot:8390964-Pyramimonas_sp.AAC.1
MCLAMVLTTSSLAATPLLFIPFFACPEAALADSRGLSGEERLLQLVEAVRKRSQHDAAFQIQRKTERRRLSGYAQRRRRDAR